MYMRLTAMVAVAVFAMMQERCDNLKSYNTKDGRLQQYKTHAASADCFRSRSVVDGWDGGELS